VFGEIPTERLVDRRGVAEHAGNVWIQQYDVGALLVPVEVLAPDAPSEVVLRSHIVIWWCVTRLLHKPAVLTRSLRER
jgi:hypothetical protein